MLGEKLFPFETELQGPYEAGNARVQLSLHVEKGCQRMKPTQVKAEIRQTKERRDDFAS